MRTHTRTQRLISDELLLASVSSVQRRLTLEHLLFIKERKICVPVLLSSGLSNLGRYLVSNPWSLACVPSLKWEEPKCGPSVVGVWIRDRGEKVLCPLTHLSVQDT